MNNIQLNIVANAQFQQVYAEVAKLKEAMASLQKVSVGGPFAPGIATDVKNAQIAFDSAIQSTRAFTIQHVAMTDSVTKFGKQLAAGQLSLNNYYKIWRESAKGVSTELDALATQQARLNRSVAIADPLRPGYAKLVTDINGVVTAQEKAIFYQKALNTALHDGATKLIDFGKNTQWMGRQLTVGLTMPLAMFGTAASQVFKQVDQELTRLAKVYGTGLVQPTKTQLDAVRKDVLSLGNELARTLGISVKDTASMAADLAATGQTGANLIKATRESLRLATLGELDHQQAMKATVSLQNVYKLNTNQLAEAVNFLNAVENQTSTSLQDLVDAIPRVGPIVQQLGGSFKDTAVMMVAMKEAGVPAAQGANAIKSAIASLINPTKSASTEFAKYKINLASIASSTGGNPVRMIEALQQSLKGLAPLVQAQLIEKLFGKFQQARIQALIDNLGKAGSQTKTVFDLMGASSSQLAGIAAGELKTQTESASGRFKRMSETIKADLLPVGQAFLNSISKLGLALDKVLSVFKTIGHVLGPISGILSKLFGGAATGLIIVGPILMLVGLFSNLAGNLLKGANYFRMFRQGMDAAAPSTNKFLAGIQNMRNFYENLDVGMVAARNQLDLMPESITSNAKAFEILTTSIKTLTTQFEALAVAQAGAMGVPMAASAFAGMAAASSAKAGSGSLNLTPLGAKLLPIVARNGGGFLPRYQSGGGISIVPGPDHINHDSVLGNVPVGGFVLNKKASKNLLRGYQSGGTIQAMLTPGELIFDPSIAGPNQSLLNSLNSGRGGKGYAGGGLIQGLLELANSVKLSGLNAEEFRLLNPSYSGSSSRIIAKGTSGLYIGDISNPSALSRIQTKHPALYDRLVNSQGVISRQKLNSHLMEMGLPGEVLLEAIRSRPAGIASGSTEQFLQALLGQGVIPQAEFDRIHQAVMANYEKMLLNNPKVTDMSNDYWGISDNAIRAFGSQNTVQLFNEFSESVGAYTSGARRSTSSNKITIGNGINIGNLRGRNKSLFAHATTPLPLQQRAINAGLHFQGGGSLAPEIIERLTAKWFKQKYHSRVIYPTPGWRPVPNETDPLHGPLHIGKLNTTQFTHESSTDRDPNSKKYGLPRFIIHKNDLSNPAPFPTGDEVERAKYQLYQYMSGFGNPALNSDPIIKEGFKKLSTPYTGMAYRGVKLNGRNSAGLPAWLAKAIYQAELTGDYSGVLGKSFMAQSASWSKDQTIAEYFSRVKPGTSGDVRSIVFHLPLQNRNVLDASSIFPNITHPFEDENGNNVYKSEQEMLLGGAFKIIDAGPGRIVLSTAPGAIPGRETGGPVSSGKPYIVGEKGPELFVPGNSGSIIPHFAGGGKVKGRPPYAPGLNLLGTTFDAMTQGLDIYAAALVQAGNDAKSKIVRAGQSVRDGVVPFVGSVDALRSNTTDSFKKLTVSMKLNGLALREDPKLIMVPLKDLGTKIKNSLKLLGASISKDANMFKEQMMAAQATASSGGGGMGGMLGGIGGKFSGMFGKLKGIKPGMGSGMGMMGANMALGMMPNKIGGTDISGAKDIASSALGVASMTAMIPGIGWGVSAAIGGAVAAFKVFSWWQDKTKKDHAKWEQSVRDSYAKLNLPADQLIGKLQQHLSTNDKIASSYQNLTIYGKMYGDVLYKTMVGVQQGTVSSSQLTKIMSKLKNETGYTSQSFVSLQLAAKAAGDTNMSNLLDGLSKVYGKTTASIQALNEFQSLAATGLDPSVIASKGYGVLADPKALKTLLEGQLSSLQTQKAAAVAGTMSSPQAITAQQQIKALDKQIKQQEDVKKTLDEQLKVMQRQQQNTQQMLDYYTKQNDLAQQAKTAEISGNYIQAAQLTASMQNETAKYNAQKAIDAQQAKVDAQQGVINALNASKDTLNATLNDISSSTSATAANTSGLDAQIAATLAAIAKLAVNPKTGTDSLTTAIAAGNGSNVQNAIPLLAPSGITTFKTATGNKMTANILADVGKAHNTGDAAYKIGNWAESQGITAGQYFTVTGKDGKQYVYAMKNDHSAIIMDNVKLPAKSAHPGMATGGLVRHFGNGSIGAIRGPGTWTSDSIPAMLSNGEYVVKASSVAQYGAGMLDAINNKRYNVPTMGNPAMHGAGAAVNQEIVFNISGVSDPQAVANMVMQKLKVANAKVNKGNGVNI